MQEIINDINKVKGLKFLMPINKEHKELIKKIESRNNLGVMESLDRNFTVLLSHDTKFRAPESNIVEIKNNQITFPPVSFSEIKAKDVVSSSPSSKVHNLLKEKLNLKLKKKEATLLVGFNL